MNLQPSTFDGYGACDPIRMWASCVVRAAIEDEIRERGHVQVSATLACFLEFRIAEALMAKFGERDDAN